MSIPLRLKYVLEEKDYLNVKEAKKIEEKELISIKERNYKICSCGTKIYEDSFSDEQLLLCSCCGKRIRKENFKEKDFIIERINYRKIIKLLQNKLEPIGYKFLDDKRLFRYNGEKPIYIIIPEISSYNFILSEYGGQNCLFIMLDEEKTKQRLLQQWQNRQWGVMDFLEKNSTNIEDISKSLQKNIAIEPDVEEKLDLLLKKSPSFFEQEFIPYFLEQLKLKNKDIQSYLLNLKLNSNDLTNSKVIVLGGAGYPDFLILDLYKYLSDGLKPDKYGEVKRYNKTKFTISDYGTALAHSNEGDNLMIVSTDDIQKEVWVKIVESMRINNYFKNVLIDKDLILLLLSLLKIEINGV